MLDVVLSGRGESGEWREGTSPSRSRRTGRETLASSGPHRSAVGVWEQVPVGEETGMVLSHSSQPSSGLGRFVPQSFELLHSPSDQVLVDAQCQGVQLGAIEGPIVVDPASDLNPRSTFM